MRRRGFTDHEHLDRHALIHMNGRMYDYRLGRFWGVDPIIQFPANSQSLNPYTYILNNPFAGTDPTGFAIRSNQLGSCSGGPFTIGCEGWAGRVPWMPLSFNGATAGAGPTGVEGLAEAEIQGGSNKGAIANAKGSSTDGLWNAFSRGFAPSIVEFRERGERGTYLDGLIGAGKEAWNTGAGLVDTARMLQDPAGFALGFHAPSPRWELGDRELGGAAIMNGATMLVPVRLGGHFAVVARNALVSERVIVGAAKTLPHKNSLDYVGQTHVYRVKGPDGTYKIGESAQGVRVSDGASIRAEQQARRLTRETGDRFETDIRKTFPDKASARDYETKLIERFRRMYGDDNLPGNKTNR